MSARTSSSSSPTGRGSDWAKILDHCETRRFSAGELLVSAGEQDRALYLLTEGTVGVRLQGDAERTFTAIDAPSVLGEVAFLDGGPRSAMLFAITDGELRLLASHARTSKNTTAV